MLKTYQIEDMLTLAKELAKREDPLGQRMIDLLEEDLLKIEVTLYKYIQGNEKPGCQNV